MKNKKLMRFVESLIMLPLTTMSGLPVGPISHATINAVSSPQTVLSQKLNTTDAIVTVTTNNKDDASTATEEAKAEAIDAYFKAHDMPLLGTGMKMVTEAEKNDLDWRLIAAIAVRESTGGKHACSKVANNPFGWGSCKIGFKSIDAAIETVAKNLGGNNSNTAMHYDDKTTIEILHAYNPPSVVPRYAEQVMSIMDHMGNENGVDSNAVAVI